VKATVLVVEFLKKRFCGIESIGTEDGSMDFVGIMEKIIVFKFERKPCQSF